MPSLNALEATRSIEANYRRYLLSTFRPRRSDLVRDFEYALRDDIQLTRGPYVQATPQFEPGSSLGDLMDEGLLSRGLDALPRAMVTRSLHRHQEEGIRKAVGDRRNLIVATGTGSGKTETFLVPILDHLLREQERGTLAEPGVRALLLYPMNALANDQVKRLREMLARFPQITFGRYIGETAYEESRAVEDFRRRYPDQPLLPNELLSRERMQQTPPAILLTNYAMLEYLLLRPQDSSLFDGSTGKHWRFLVLDEAHVYGGAQGAEVAMLVRRLKDRVVSSRTGALQAFATSATLGAGRQDYPALLRFGRTLFSEPFEWDDVDPGRQDIIEAHRLPLTRGEPRGALSDQVIRELARAHAEPSLDGLSSVALEHGLVPPSGGESGGAYLFSLLRHDARVVRMQEQLQRGAVLLRDLADDLCGGDSDLLVDLVDLCVAAKPDPDAAPLLPARYHFFVRGLEAATACLHPDHVDGTARLRLSRSKVCDSCIRHGRDSHMFELGVCRSCHAEFVVGRRGGGDLLRDADHERDASYFLLAATGDGDDDDEASLTGRVSAAYSFAPTHLCVACGQLGPRACRCSSPTIDVVEVIPPGGERLSRCPSCSSRTSGDIVMRFVTGGDAPGSVVASALYQQLPPSRDPRHVDVVGEGRKLLTFSDSRQDAAFFAPFLERTYQRGIQRRLIQQTLEEARDPELALEDVVIAVRRLGEDQLILDPDASRTTNEREVNTWLAQEVLAFDRRLSLEGVGLAEISPAVPRKHRPPAFLTDLGLSEHEIVDLVLALLGTVRQQGAVETPQGVDIRDRRFEPRNYEVGFREIGPERGVQGWRPSVGANSRLDLLQKVFAARGIGADPSAVLSELWRFLTSADSPWAQVWVSSSHRKAGVLHRLAWDRLRIAPVSDSHRPGRCDRCRRLWWRTVAEVCPGWRCDGTVRPVGDTADLRSDHYASLYLGLLPAAMSVAEHTAQWTSSEASALQDRFTRGALNVLSCSTTFELGVDVGDVQAVFLRNMPPSPANYVQRAGRAGRRTGSAALVVTFAQRRSHDLTFFNRPDRMVNGVVDPPVIHLENEAIVRRHLHSVAFAAFERSWVDAGNEQHGTVEAFFEKDADGCVGVEALEGWLRDRPAGLGSALRRVVPAELQGQLGLTEWAWVDALTRPSEEEPTHGWLMRAAGEAQDDLRRLTDQFEEAVAERDLARAQRLERVRTTMARQQLIGYLSRKNVLPKYGFPVDVVSLDISGSGTDLSTKLELSRDLRVAISEYAPGSKVVAGGRLWESRGLRVRQNMAWPHYAWGECASCGAFRKALGSDLPTTCTSCGSENAGSKKGVMVVPLFGFVGIDSDAPGEARPPRSGFADSYFAAYRDEVPLYQPVAGAAAGLEARTSKQGQVVVINRGRFRICEWCGHTEAVTTGGGGRRERSHPRLDGRGRECKGTLQFRQLGHEYLSDVLELKVGLSSLSDAVESLLYALIEGAAVLGIPRDDLAGTLSHDGSLVIFDAVPGGAGHAQRIHDNLIAVMETALDRMRSCPDCEIDSSCYSCLRSYSNQRSHDRLRRGLAIEMLELLLGRRDSDAPVGLDLVDPRVHDLLREVLELGAPAPVVGHELDDPARTPVELAWPRKNVCITLGDDSERDSWLHDRSWTFGGPDDFTPERIAALVR